MIFYLNLKSRKLRGILFCPA